MSKRPLIIVPVDGSQETEHTVQCALSVAKQRVPMFMLFRPYLATEGCGSRSGRIPSTADGMARRDIMARKRIPCGSSSHCRPLVAVSGHSPGQLGGRKAHRAFGSACPDS